MGDIHGCAREFDQLLGAIDFQPGRDELWCLGDLINRGPDSLTVLRRWCELDGRAVLGNHDIHGLLAHSGRKPKRLPTLEGLFAAEDGAALLDRLRRQPLLVFLPSPGAGPDVWAVHAGVHPGWHDLHQAAARINGSPEAHDDDWLQHPDTAFATQVRCCAADGERHKHFGPPEACPVGSGPWDSFYRGEATVIHGHWGTRGHYRTAKTIGLDSGCVYGGALTAWCQDEDRIVQVPADPGA
ncbi:hypothetical protein ABI59_10775 [Acidobacteria bacterium Mor1]|nr:hypothetical protein ABI59_10775 [Acidobacteria bacterium Mor1]